MLYLRGRICWKKISKGLDKLKFKAATREHSLLCPALWYHILQASVGNRILDWIAHWQTQCVPTSSGSRFGKIRKWAWPREGARKAREPARDPEPPAPPELAPWWVCGAFRPDPTGLWKDRPTQPPREWPCHLLWSGFLSSTLHTKLSPEQIQNSPEFLFSVPNLFSPHPFTISPPSTKKLLWEKKFEVNFLLWNLLLWDGLLVNAHLIARRKVLSCVEGIPMPWGWGGLRCSRGLWWLWASCNHSPGRPHVGLTPPLPSQPFPSWLHQCKHQMGSLGKTPYGNNNNNAISWARWRIRASHPLFYLILTTPL